MLIGGEKKKAGESSVGKSGVQRNERDETLVKRKTK